MPDDPFPPPAMSEEGRKDANLSRVFLLTIALFAAVTVIGGVVFVASRGGGDDTQDDAGSPRQDSVQARSGDNVERALADETGAGLTLASYRYDPGARIIEGTVLNNTNFPHVNVRVGFSLVRSDSSVLGEARDTTSEVGPGESWEFRIPVTEDGVTAARFTGLQARAMQVTGPLSNPNVTRDQAGRGGDEQPSAVSPTPQQQGAERRQGVGTGSGNAPQR